MKKKILRICKRCGNEFYVFPSILKREGRGQYCSRKCRENKIEKVCSQCGKKFKTIKSRENTARYCSKKCKDSSLIDHVPWNKGKNGVMPIPWNKGKKVPQISGVKHWLYGKTHPSKGKGKGKIVINCSQCGKKFSKRRKYMSREAKYTSIKITREARKLVKLQAAREDKPLTTIIDQAVKSYVPKSTTKIAKMKPDK